MNSDYLSKHIQGNGYPYIHKYKRVNGDKNRVSFMTHLGDALI